MQCNGFETGNSLLKSVVVCQPGTTIKGKNRDASYSGLPLRRSARGWTFKFKVRKKEID